MAIHIEQRFQPLIIVRYDGPTSDADFEAYLETLWVSMTERNAGQRVLLHDATLAYPITAKQRKRQADWMQQHSEKISQLTVGCAFVISSSLMRGVLTAIFWIHPLPCPQEVCATVPEALGWCTQKLEASGLRMPIRASSYWADPTVSRPLNP